MQHYTLQWHDIIGILGVLIILVTYFLLQCDRIIAQSYTYSLLNIIGSLLILYSLLYDWNLSAVMIEICWAMISFIGLVRHYFKTQKK